jgi:hypothetical protein
VKGSIKSRVITWSIDSKLVTGYAKHDIGFLPINHGKGDEITFFPIFSQLNEIGCGFLSVQSIPKWFNNHANILLLAENLERCK